MVAAIRRVSSLVSNFAAEALPGCLARHNQERFTVEVLIRSFESFRHTTHRVASSCFRSTRAARCGAEHIEDHDVANPAGSFANANYF